MKVIQFLKSRRIEPQQKSKATPGTIQCKKVEYNLEEEASRMQSCYSIQQYSLPYIFQASTPMQASTPKLKNQASMSQSL